MPSLIKLENIDLEAGTQIRIRINSEIVEEYAECMKNGDKFPPIIVFKKRRANYILADGFHRYRAAEKNKQKKINCEIQEGDERDALAFALSANASHGLRRSNKDKRKAVTIALKDEEWQRLSNHELARLCSVSEFLVRNIKKELKVQSDERVYKNRFGTVTKMNTKKIGKTKSPVKNSKQQVQLSTQLKTYFPKTLSNQLEKYSSKQNMEEIEVVKQALKLFFSQQKNTSK